MWAINYFTLSIVALAECVCLPARVLNGANKTIFSREVIESLLKCFWSRVFFAAEPFITGAPKSSVTLEWIKDKKFSLTRFDNYVQLIVLINCFRTISIRYSLVEGPPSDEIYSSRSPAKLQSPGCSSKQLSQRWMMRLEWLSRFRTEKQSFSPNCCFQRKFNLIFSVMTISWPTSQTRNRCWRRREQKKWDFFHVERSWFRFDFVSENCFNRFRRWFDSTFFSITETTTKRFSFHVKLQLSPI